MDQWPFENDADRDDPLAELRIAVTSSHPQWRYLVAFDRESEARPTEAEARMLASYLDEYKQHWYNPGYLKVLAARPLDVDGGANGVVFHKWAQDDWGYRRQSYERGYLFTVIPPAMRDRYTDGVPGPLSLERLMDYMRSYGLGGQNMRWVEWKVAHPDIFSPVICPYCERDDCPQRPEHDRLMSMREQTWRERDAAPTRST